MASSTYGWRRSLKLLAATAFALWLAVALAAFGVIGSGDPLGFSVVLTAVAGFATSLFLAVALGTLLSHLAGPRPSR